MTVGPQNSGKDETASVAGQQALAAEPGITQATFAARRGVSEAMVSRWKAKGMLVLDSEGRVLEAASNARLRATLDPGRGGDRTGRQRPPVPAGATSARPAAQGAPEGGYDPDPDRLNYQREAARDKRASAMQRELELARDAGQLLHADEVTNRIAHHVRSAIDVLAARRRSLAPKLALETDPRKVEQLLEQADREFCQALVGLATTPDGDTAEAA
ncbi:hypothetical protein [Stenotrophomonas pigmentata]|uniref:hypothetical protein n=1 Tax=Stenotrophomonas pigmentata TaxID=3055080 RepID=UPI0026ECA74E|nr:hypothetical protein [Stenotrophomonas sp. 610A2]